MSARCAGCMLPIVKGEPFLLADTEVFHRACVLNGRVATSLSTQLRLENAKLRGQLAAEQGAAAEAAHLRTRIDDANRDARAVRGERDNFERNLNRALARLGETAEALSETTETLNVATRLAEARRLEIDRLTRDKLALEARLAQVAQPDQTSERRDTKDPVDDAAVRFGLLELDPLE